MTITVKDLTEKIHFHIVYATETSLTKLITTADITRPGLEMTGYFDFFSPERIQLFGMKEWSYMMEEVGNDRYELLTKIFSKETPAVIVARELQIPEEMQLAAKYRDVTLLQSTEPTSRLSGKLSSFLDERLAPRTIIHGVLMDIDGVGVLIQGTSGIGKSETGIELISHGHRLVADDRVDVYKADEFTVVGEAPEVLRNMIEIRGLGIIDAMMLFGTGAIKDNSPINLVVALESFQEGQEYDRLGESQTVIELAEVRVPLLRIPVKVGRNVAMIIEIAVKNFLAKEKGHNATKIFEDRLTLLMEKNRSVD